MRTGYCSIGILISITLLLVASNHAFAMQNPPSAPPEPKEEFIVLVPVRDVAEIQRDIESADKAQTAAGEAERTAQDQRSSVASLLEEKKQAIAANKEKLKAAKQQKNDTEVSLLTADGKALERDKDLLDQQQALRDAEISLAQKQNELAMLTKQALDLEKQLAGKRADQTVSNVSKPDLARTARRLVDFEKTTLEAQKKVADKQADVADAGKKVIEHRLKTLEAQQNIYGGK